jgi:hypothetical protein
LGFATAAVEGGRNAWRGIQEKSGKGSEQIDFCVPQVFAARPQQDIICIASALPGPHTGTAHESF